MNTKMFYKQISILVLTLVVLVPIYAWAADLVDQQTGRTIGYDMSPFSTRQVNQFGICRNITNNNTFSIFIPTNTVTEWQSFITAYDNGQIPNIILSGCSGCVPNFGQACTSGANACGQTSSGTIQCNGSCSATTPSNPANYGTSCFSSANACGQTNSGTIQCNGSCLATTPSNPANYGNVCFSPPNSCNQTNTGTIQCNGLCSAVTPAESNCGPGCVPNQGQPCESEPNACGQKGSGVIQCDGSCSAVTPANPALYGTACQSSANACGQTASGTIDCNGSCSATTPSNPANYGTACQSTANACGQTNPGAIQCNGSCSATTPTNPANYGMACQSAANACGQTNSGTVDCSGNCSASVPSNPANYGQACEAGNICGTNYGTLDCSGDCSAEAPYCKIGCTDPTASNYCDDCNYNSGCIYPQPAQCTIYTPIIGGGCIYGSGSTIVVDHGQTVNLPLTGCSTWPNCHGSFSATCNNGSWSDNLVCNPGFEI